VLGQPRRISRGAGSVSKGWGAALRRLPGGVISGLQAVQEVHGALRVGGSGEDRPLVVLQDLQP